MVGTVLLAVAGWIHFDTEAPSQPAVLSAGRSAVGAPAIEMPAVGEKEETVRGDPELPGHPPLPLTAKGAGDRVGTLRSGSSGSDAGGWLGDEPPAGSRPNEVTVKPPATAGFDPDFEVVTEMSPPSVGATVSLRKGAEGYVIEIREPKPASAVTPPQSRNPRPRNEPEAGEQPAGAVAESLAESAGPAWVMEAVGRHRREPTTVSVDVGKTSAGAQRQDGSVSRWTSDDRSQGPGASDTGKNGAARTVAGSASRSGERSGARETSRPPRRQLLIHTVIRGDTLWHIATRYLGDPFRYPELARSSRIRNPDLIHPGDKVRIVRYLYSTEDR